MTGDLFRKQPARMAIVYCALTIGTTTVLFPTGAAAQNWGTPVWSEEFNGTTVGPPSTTTWNFDLGNSGWGNNELETYCGPPAYPTNPTTCPTSFSTSTSNAYIDGNGHLIIQAIKSGSTWTSARMNTLTNPPGTFAYGRIEARMKLPIGAGLWPAFWALGSNIQSVSWPGCGEMDFMENVPASAGLGPTVISSTIHGPVSMTTKSYGHGQKHTFPSGDVTSFHTYGAIWSPYMVQFYVDDPTKVFFIVTASDLASNESWVFNHPFILLLNLAVGGNWPGPPDNTTPNPAIMMVDYVRYYQAAAVAPPNLGNPASISIPVGATTGSTSANLTAVSGSGRMYLNCTASAGSGYQCAVNTGNSLSPSVVDFTSANGATATITVSPVTATPASMLPTPRFGPKMRFWTLGVLLSSLIGIVARRTVRARGRGRWASGMALAGLLFAGLLVASCGRNSSPPPASNPPSHYAVTLNAYTETGNGQAPDATVDIQLLVYH